MTANVLLVHYFKHECEMIKRSGQSGQCNYESTREKNGRPKLGRRLGDGANQCSCEHLLQAPPHLFYSAAVRCETIVYQSVYAVLRVAANPRRGRLVESLATANLQG